MLRTGKGVVTMIDYKRKYEEEFEGEYELICKKCGYHWIRREMSRLPKSCPGCKAQKFYEPRKR